MKKIDLKLKRAFEHINSILADFEKWSSENQIDCRCEFLPDKKGFKIIVDSTLELVEIEKWELDFGDCIHNLRSLLDNLIYLLALKVKSPPDKPSKLKFPIYYKEQDFINQTRQLLIQLPQSVSEKLKLIQPFQRENNNVEGTPQDDPLYLLNSISNIDKHRIPLEFELPPDSLEQSGQIKFRTDEEATLNCPPNVKIFIDNITKGGVIMEYLSNHPLKEVSGDFKFKTKPMTVINGKKYEVLKLMPYLLWYTELVVNQFREYFD
ncbi:hypothetical protein H0I31_09020 [Tenacibaculum sp. AHE15PA]|uniref:hypothetical protein n=1 Tax=unclassified Tenacibaculum TaxID=2635139 RepID=UPI001C5003CF|nr:MULTISPECIES: hypothetical protein [unclassified Tenacibaculum]QXP74310.1 hypothetical protein H0I30_03950 [Tenacibaculum sp. AHE14PA]QXP75320.1 hypothetical protein H0I31_09020 [Tenacibaculum sp. AHE15PA]